MSLLKDNVTVTEEAPAFDLMSNRCDYFEIGTKDGGDVWLEGEISAEDEIDFIFNGRLFCANGGSATIIDGFPKSDPPAGWSKHPIMSGTGWELRDANGELVFGFSRDDVTCRVDVGLHRANGEPAAIAGQGGLVVTGVRLRLGRGGILLG